VSTDIGDHARASVAAQEKRSIVARVGKRAIATGTAPPDASIEFAPSETAALRDFNPAYDPAVGQSRRIDAVPP